jgi:NAD(P)H-dependent FMN reductase
MAESNTKSIAVIIGSTRPKRICDQVTKLVTDTIENHMKSNPNNNSPEVKLTTISIASFNLPIFDEVPVPAIVPAFAQYEHSYSLKWSAEMAKYDGYILVTPEYNSGPPGSVKNAFDYLYHELQQKPIMIVSYGRIGGLS